MILLGEMKTQEETRRKSSLKWFIIIILFVINDVWWLYNSFSGFILQYVQAFMNKETIAPTP